MILSLICVAALQTATASDFFPVIPGTVRTYEKRQKHAGNEVLTSTVGNVMDMGGVKVVPITETAAAGAGTTTYFRVDPDQVSIVAFNANKPMLKPMPVLRIGTGKVAWNYEGTTQTGENGEGLRGHGDAWLAGQRTVLGKKVDVLIVKLATVLGMGISAVMYDQTTIYGRGIGMIEQTNVQKLGKKSIEYTWRIVSFEPGK